MQAHQGLIKLSLVSGVYVLVNLYGVPLLCAPPLLPNVMYLFVWDVGVGNFVYGTVYLSVLYLFSYVSGDTISQMMSVWGGVHPLKWVVQPLK